MKNRVKEFVDSRGITPYRFMLDTGISRTTVYDLYKDSDQYLGKNVIEAICRTYKVQPGELLYWEPDESEAEVA